MAPPVPFFAWLREGLRTFGFDGDPKTDVFQLVFQLALAAGAALIAYWLIHRSQMRATEEGRRIERARAQRLTRNTGVSTSRRRCSRNSCTTLIERWLRKPG